MSNILKPLTVMSGKKTILIWNDSVSLAFFHAKAILAQVTMLFFADFFKLFDLHTNSSDCQLGSVLSQDNKPIVFFSRKLNSALLNYTVIDKEFLEIAESLKDFRHIILGNRINAYTGNKSLTTSKPI